MPKWPPGLLATDAVVASALGRHAARSGRRATHGVVARGSGRRAHARAAKKLATLELAWRIALGVSASSLNGPSIALHQNFASCYG
jgi:hypothetical protein